MPTAFSCWEGTSGNGVNLPVVVWPRGVTEILCMRGHSMLENRDSSEAFVAEVSIGSVGKTCGRNLYLHAVLQSDIDVVPKTESNKVAWCHEVKEVLEERLVIKG